MRMTENLTNAIIRRLPLPAKGNRTTYDGSVRGFGMRVTAAGAKSFVLRYSVRSSGRERSYTIGSFPEWSTPAAREEARRLKRDIDVGADPLADLKTEWAIPKTQPRNSVTP